MLNFAQQLSRVFRVSLACATTSVMIAGCGATLDNSEGSGLKLPDITGAIGTSSSVVKKGTPVELYTRVARGIKTCWFSGDRIDFKKYLFFAETSQETKVGSAGISIHEFDKNGRRGLKAYEVKFESIDGGTYVEPKNYRLDAVTSKQLELAVNRYADNKLSCEIPPLQKSG